MAEADLDGIIRSVAKKQIKVLVDAAKKRHDPAAPPAAQIGFDQFLAVDIRIGTIIAVDPFPEARKPAFKLTIDFGPGIGTKRSSAQLTQNYEAAQLVGRQVAGVVNFPPRQIGKFMPMRSARTMA